MKDPSMKQLRYFDALARFGHFGRAAEVCSVTQPALSVQIKELEETLGITLVERGSRQIRLTSIGETMALRVREVLRAVDEMSDFARASHGPLSGRMRIGVIPTIAPYLLPRLITKISTAYPTLDIHPREAITQTLIAGLMEGSIDAAIVALPMSEPTLTEVPLFDEEFVLVRPVADANKPVPNPEKLSKMRLLLLEEGHCFRDQAISFCKLTSSAPRDLMEGSSLSTLVQMVGVGIGVTLIPEMAVEIETKSAAVSVVRLPEPRPTRTIGMVWRKSNPLADQFSDIANLVLFGGVAAR